MSTASTNPPANSDPKILADWFERRISTRKEAVIIALRLAAFYASKADAFYAAEAAREVKDVA